MPCSRPSALQPCGQTPSRHPIVLTSLLLAALALAALPPSARAAGPRYFPETGHNVPEVFLNYWTARGGLAIFGLPLTEPYQEGPLLVQWFERGRFERHPENAGTPYEVLLGQLGRETRAPDPPTIPVGGTAARFFPESGHNLAIFRAYWERHNGLALFGLPLTEELRERSALDGKEYTVQYFERARLEHHPEQNGTAYEVLLGQLGRERYEAVKAENPTAAAAGVAVAPPVVAAAPPSSIDTLMWETINKDRAAAGVKPLALDPLVSKAASIHVADMIANNFIDHTGSDGSTPQTRMRRLGVVFRFGSENVSMECARDQATAVRNIRAWMMAEPLAEGLYNHRWNLMHGGYTRIGIAFGIAKNGCWVMAEVFADGEPSPGSLR